MQDITLLKGNCYDLIKDIPDKSVDLVVIDPPYDMDSGGTGKKELALRFRKRYNELKEKKELALRFRKRYNELKEKELDKGMDLSFLTELERICRNIYIYMV